MGRTEHLTVLRTWGGASNLYLSAWSVKTRGDPSRPSISARAYGQTTTVMHNIDYTPLQPKGEWGEAPIFVITGK